VRIVKIPWKRAVVRSIAIGASVVVAALGLSSCRPSPGHLTVTTVVSGLDHPWDLAFTPGGSMVFTERSGPIKIRKNTGTMRTLADPADVQVLSEGGMLGIAVDPNFSQNRRIYTCFLSNKGGALDVRVVRWRINNAVTALGERADIVTGIPVNQSGQTGRHSGCRPRFGPDGNLWIGTGDSATGTVPQSPTSLGGKVLRVDTNGAGVSGNMTAPFDHRIYNYGHRNVQGLAFSPGGKAYSIEHGTDRDDEINRLVAKANYGWDPVPDGGGTGYDESQPMTDFEKFPNAVGAVWSSGNPTIAPSGGTFLHGDQWKGWNASLAVAVLKGQQLRIIGFTGDGNHVEQQWVPITNQGRLRTAVQGPDGDLYIAQDASPGKILRVHPTD
jgi:glucose/arabinose dehydrogenase